ncbi:MAG: hypothetical protein M3406_01805 [Chloroflexota bacterium]|nr:hypothetical protein [Chloroflexota bacterium]
MDTTRRTDRAARLLVALAGVLLLVRAIFLAADTMTVPSDPSHLRREPDEAHESGR